jgi:dolichyl-phosphate-mannose--protein O-mannosyl transferase
VTCFHGRDSGDAWRVEIQGDEKVWTRNRLVKVRLTHVNTSVSLHSHAIASAGPSHSSQNEVSGYQGDYL